jgi:hypothetical protein
MSERDEIARLIERLERAAYERGWAEAISAVTRTATGMTSGAAPSKALRASRPRKVAKSPKQPRVVIARARATKEQASAAKGGRIKRGVGITSVRNAVSKQPGLTGSQVVEAIRVSGAGVDPRTVRTSLRRLKLENIIEQREGRWYPSPGAPASESRPN